MNSLEKLYHQLTQLTSRNSYLVNLGRKAREQYELLQERIRVYEEIVSTTNVILFSVLFVLFAAAEWFSSWEIYTDLAKVFSLDPPVALISVFALAVVGTAVLVSWLLEMTISSSLRQWRVEVLSSTTNYRSFPPYEIERLVSIRQRKKFWTGLIVGLLLVGVVAHLSYEREWMMNQLLQHPGEETGLSYVRISLPPLLVVLEILTGIFLIYGIHLLALSLKRSSQRKQWKAQVRYCHRNDHRITRIWNHLLELGYKAPLNREVQEALYRTQHRSTSDDNYLDEIPEPATALVKPWTQEASELTNPQP